MSVLLQAITTRVPANAEVIQHVRSGLLVLAHRTPSSVPQGQGKISGEKKKKHEKENAPERKKRKAHDNLSLPRYPPLSASLRDGVMMMMNLIVGR